MYIYLYLNAEAFCGSDLLKQRALRGKNSLITSHITIGKNSYNFSYENSFSSPEPRIDPRLLETLCRRTCAVGFSQPKTYGACSLLVLTWMHQLETILIVVHENQWEDTLVQGSPELFSPSVKRRALGSRLMKIEKLSCNGQVYKKGGFRAGLHDTIFVACEKLTTGLRHDLRLSQRFKPILKCYYIFSDVHNNRSGPVVSRCRMRQKSYRVIINRP